MTVLLGGQSTTKGTMRTTESTFISEVLKTTTKKTTMKTQAIVAAAFVAIALTGCEKKGDAITAAEQADKKTSIAAPGIAETKAIAEEGFIYGLPLVMNYAVMNEFAVDTKSSQFKAPFNEINNQHRVSTPEDTAVITPNSDTPYSMVWLDLRAEPMVVSVPAVEKERYYSVQLIDGNTYNYGYIGSRATGNDPGDYLVVGPDWKGETPAGIKKVFSSTTPFALTLFRTQLFDPRDMPNVEKVQAGYKVQPLSAFLKQPAPPAAPKIDFVPATTAGIKENFYEYLSALSSSCHRRQRTRISGPNSRVSASDRARPLSSRISRSNTKPPSCWP